ncbi:MAG: DUF2798 domain-containing protein [Bacteroidota bacterium]
MKQRIVFALIMSTITTCIISFTLVSLNVGFNERFLAIWARSWAIAFLIATLSILFVGPIVQKWVQHLFRAKD